MIEGLKPYGEYKESGLPWLVDMPANWEIEKAKRLFKKMQRPVRSTDEVVTCFRDGTVTLRKNRRLRGFTEAVVESGYQGIRKGDLVIHGMDAFAGAIGVSDSDGKGTPVYNVCLPAAGVDANYYAHAIREMSRSNWILALAKGIRERSTDFRFEMFGNQFVPLPPPPEQAAIVKFLDHVNHKIDRFIRTKKRLIALLNEQKQAIIHRAVTHGLNVDVAFKDSGVAWLGEIPQHWEVWPLRRCISIKSGDFFDSENSSPIKTTSRPIPVIGGNGLMGYTNKSNNFDSTIVIGRVGALCGNVHVIDGAAWITDNALLIPRVIGFNKDFLASQLRAMNLNRLSNANAQPLITGGIVKSQKVARAPLQEQTLIMSKIPVLIFPIEAAITRTEREIALMLEYRTRLVSDVVTGKLDVRGAAAGLPDVLLDTGAEVDVGDVDMDVDFDSEELDA